MTLEREAVSEYGDSVSKYHVSLVDFGFPVTPTYYILIY